MGRPKKVKPEEEEEQAPVSMLPIIENLAEMIREQEQILIERFGLEQGDDY